MTISAAASSFRSCSAAYVPAAPLPMITKRVESNGKRRLLRVGCAQSGRKPRGTTRVSVPEEGLEPPRPFEQSVLSAQCLPFHHSGQLQVYGRVVFASVRATT